MTKVWQDLTDMFDSEDYIEEMNKKYKGTYLRISADSLQILAKYNGWNGSHHVFIDEHGSPITLADDTKHTVKIWMPKRGLYNSADSGILVFVRLPWRQYRRGISKESASISSLTTRIFGGSETNNLDRFVYQLADIRLQKEVTLEEAIEKTKEAGSWAINRLWGVSLNVQGAQEDVYHLFYEDVLVADVVGHEIRVKEEAFFQEIIEDYSDWAFNFKVIV
jgi:hypothetical protein